MRFCDIKGSLPEGCEIFREGAFEKLGPLSAEFNAGAKALSFINSEQYLDMLFHNASVTAVFCPSQLIKDIEKAFSGGICIADDPRLAFLLAHNYLCTVDGFYSEPFDNEIADSAQIHHTAIIAEKNVRIGKNSVISANVVIYENTTIGENVIIRENSVVGSPAFYYYDNDDVTITVNSSGSVMIGDHVELHTGVCVEKGVFGGVTRIDEYSKVDNLCLIEHDVAIGRRCKIAGASVFAGWASIGQDSFCGVGVSVAPKVKIGAGCKLSAGAVVTKDVEDGHQVSGNFAIDHKRFIEHIKKISG